MPCLHAARHRRCDAARPASLVPSLEKDFATSSLIGKLDRPHAYQFIGVIAYQFIGVIAYQFIGVIAPTRTSSLIGCSMVHKQALLYLTSLPFSYFRPTDFNTSHFNTSHEFLLCSLAYDRVLLLTNRFQYIPFQYIPRVLAVLVGVRQHRRR